MSYTIKWRRPDSTYVIEMNGMPYLVAQGDPLYDEVHAAGAEAPLEPLPPETSSTPSGPVLQPGLFKTDLIERMTDPELEAFETGMNAADRRSRMMWENCVTVVHGTPYWDALYAAFVGAFGETRASEIMAR